MRKEILMKILIINGSPYKENSTTLKITRAFMEGLNETAEIVHTIDLEINPCRACYACWVKTNGKCVQNDEAIAVLNKIREADLVIWSIPLYCYSAPRTVKPSWTEPFALTQQKCIWG
ncbi:flavodoxin family protein [Clostridioides difficile]|nr:flavodoxin family protein [Clostridioides difficile]